MTNSKWFGTSDADPIGDILRRLNAVEAYANDLERKIGNFDSPQPISRVDPVSYLNPFEGQRAIDPSDEQHMWYSNGQWRKAGGFAVYEIKVFEDLQSVITGDDKFIWEIPEELDQGQIVRVEAFNTTAGSGTTTIALRKGAAGSAGSDILSTNISIDSGEYNSKDAGTQPVVIADTIASWGEHLHIDVDAAGSGAKGLGVIVVLVPSDLASIVLAAAQGEQGEPGGITAWTGQWLTATGYTQDQAVSNNGSSYVAINPSHTSGASTEPGVGANWEDEWMLLAEAGSSASYGTSLPGSPVDGDEYILVDSTTAPTYQWHLRYNAGSASSYKWEFVGGDYKVTSVGTDESTTTQNTWLNLTTDGPSFTTPYDGDWEVIGSCFTYNTATGAHYCGVAVGNTTPSVMAAVLVAITGTATSIPSAIGVILAVAASSVLKLRYFQTNNTTANFSGRQLMVRPRRLG